MENIKNEMLKVDIKICSTFKPDVKVKHYIKTKCKCSRIIMFVDNTFIHIETDNGKWGFWDEFSKYQANIYQINVTNKVIDKNGRVITMFKLF
jgi:hypothetical protein